MRIIPPRLNHLLRILLRSHDPISVQELGVQLSVSRRTVFRELENTDQLLESFGLRIGTVTGQGIVLEGNDSGRNQLLAELDHSGNREAAGRQERHTRLVLSLLQEKKPQKLFYYANLLRVSEATISNDLDRIEDFLGKYHLRLVRKQSYGVHVEGGETSMRRACVSILHGEKKEPQQTWNVIPGKPVIERFSSAVSPQLRRICAWMTPESQEALERYLLVSVQRMIDGFEVETRFGDDAYRSIADEIALLLETAYAITLSEAERGALSVELSACRNNTTLIPPRESKRDSRLLHLAYRMIEAFDPSVASVLKQDEDLLDGLVFHLRPFLVRLEQQVELQDPLLDQIEENYPELMVKSARAVRVSVDENGWMPESEISFFAMHFGAAVHRLEERGIRKRTIRIGVVCLNGIGTSYLLAAQIRKHFEADAAIEVSGWENPQEWERYDLLVSTVALPDAQAPVLTVPPFLDDVAVHRIGLEINRHSLELPRKLAEQQRDDSLSPRLAQLKELCGDMQLLLEQFDTISVPADCSFEGLTKLAGYRFGDGESNGRMICEGLAEREKLSTQVVPEMGFILLHCRTDGVAHPVFALLSPDGGQYMAPCFQGCKSCVLLLMPRKANRERTELMGRISGAIVENESFLQAILMNDKERVGVHLEEILQGYLVDYMKKNWKG
jgi:mannitol operon transcriptional antiterminator